METKIDNNELQSQEQYSQNMDPNVIYQGNSLEGNPETDTQNSFTDNALTSPKKRKLDKDGFVTPATPDIPKMSSYYDQQSKKQQSTDDEQTRAVNSLQAANENSIVTVPHEPSSQALTPAGDLVTELGEEIKGIYFQFFSVFRESEEYEMMGPDKLDKLLEQAQALEKNLIQQKCELINRLQGLSETLKLV